MDEVMNAQREMIASAKYAALERAAERAAERGLVAVAVRGEDEAGYHYLVRSLSHSRGGAFHVVTLRDGRWHCPCPGAAWARAHSLPHAGIFHFCHHVGAVFAAWRVATPSALVLAEALASASVPPPPPAPKPPRRRASSSSVYSHGAASVAALTPAVIRALEAQPGSNRINNYLAQARRTFTRQCDMIIAGQSPLQNIPRSARKMSAE